MPRLMKRTPQEHKLTKTEEPGKLHWYDDAGKQHAVSDGFPGIRTF